MNKIASVTTRIALMILTVSAAGVLAFVDTAPGNTFATKGLDLKIDSRAWYNGEKVKELSWKLKNLVPGTDHFFSYDDIKPGDSGKTIISMHVKKSSAWLCLDFTNLTGEENGHNEPEGEVDEDDTSELLEGMELFAWIDDGDNVFEVGEKPLFGTTTQKAIDVINDKTYPIADWKKGPACGDNETRYVGIFWCAGDLSVNLATAQITCDASLLGNEAQTDSLSVDILIRAYPAKEHPKLVCKGEKKGGGKKNDKDENNGNHSNGNGNNGNNGHDDEDEEDNEPNPPIVWNIPSIVWNPPTITFPTFPTFPSFPSVPFWPFG
jgi:hypothetical protein